MLKLFQVTFIVFLFFGFIACSDSDNPTKASDPDSPQFTTRNITLPQGLTNSSNNDAQELVAMIDALENFESDGCCFACPADAPNQESSYSDLKWTLRWQCEQNLDNELLITTGQDRHTWQLFYEGSKDGVNFEHWKRMEAVQTFEKSSGHVNLYIENSRNTEIEWVWYNLTDGSYRFDKTLMVPEIYKMSLKLNSDYSGEFEIYSIDHGKLDKTKRYVWYVNGKGEWWEYENGKQKKHGIWG